jgi:hypothetical protein
MLMERQKAVLLGPGTIPIFRLPQSAGPCR